MDREQEFAIDISDDEMWFQGMLSHRKTKEERMAFIHHVRAKESEVSVRQYISWLSNMMHTYFYSMDPEEKQNYIDSFVQAPVVSPSECGELLEILGILFKSASECSKEEIFSCIQRNASVCAENPSAIVSLCNCVRCVYNDVTPKQKDSILELLLEIKRKNKFPFVNESIQLTIHTMKEVCV